MRPLALAFLVLVAAETAGESLLSTALVVADSVSVPRMIAEKNLTWQSSQLEDLARLYGKAGRLDRAVALVRDLDTPERVKLPAMGRIAVAALEAGEKKRADDLIQQISASREWTAPAALASIARALHAAGDPRGLRLAGEIEDPLERGRFFLDLGALQEALRAGSQIEPESVHVPRAGGSAWEFEYSARQSFLLEVLRAAVAQGDQALARKALEELGRVPDPSLFLWRGRALLDLAGDDANTLRQILKEVEAAGTESMGELRDKVDLMAELAVRLPRDEAAEALKRTDEMARRAESVPDPGIRTSYSTEMLARIAVAWADLGRTAEAREVLARAARHAESVPVEDPPAASHGRVEARAQVAAAFERIGESGQAAATLAKAVADLDTIKSEEWRGYSWHSIVEAYQKAGKLDLALEALGTKSRAADRFDAIVKLADMLPPSDLPRLAPLVASLPASFLKIDLSARIANQLAMAGRPAEAAQITTAALQELGKKPERWDLALIHLAIEIPDADRPADTEQRKALQSLLRGVSARLRED